VPYCVPLRSPHNNDRCSCTFTEQQPQAFWRTVLHRRVAVHTGNAHDLNLLWPSTSLVQRQRQRDRVVNAHVRVDQQTQRRMRRQQRQRVLYTTSFSLHSQQSHASASTAFQSVHTDFVHRIVDRFVHLKQQCAYQPTMKSANRQTANGRVSRRQRNEENQHSGNLVRRSVAAWRRAPPECLAGETSPTNRSLPANDDISPT
jgi:hypothetical protein